MIKGDGSEIINTHNCTYYIWKIGENLHACPKNGNTLNLGNFDELKNAGDLEIKRLINHIHGTINN